MRRLHRYFGSLLLGAALLAPLLTSGCAIRARDRHHEEEEEEHEHRDFRNHDQYRDFYQFQLPDTQGQRGPVITYSFAHPGRR
jgi:hypothetical protein